MKQEQLQLTGGGDQTRRRALDFYPTPKNATVVLMDFLLEEGRIDTDFKIWEPACGNGAMSKVIESYGIDVFSSDISEESYGVPLIDFTSEHKFPEFDAIITNPPFNLSEQFIRKATERSRVVCLLLKSQYWHASSRLSLFNELTPAYVLPLTWRPDFLEHERGIGDKKGAPTMEVAWSVWIRGSKPTYTIYKPLSKPNAK